jgi:hypothetical protein
VVGTPGFFSWRKKRETRKSRYSDWAGFSSYWSKISTFSNFPPQPGPNKLHTHPNPIVVHLYSPPPPGPPARAPPKSGPPHAAIFRHRTPPPHAPRRTRTPSLHARTCAVGWPPLWLLPHKLSAVLVDAQPCRTSSPGSPSATSFGSSSRWDFQRHLHSQCGHRCLGW